MACPGWLRNLGVYQLCRSGGYSIYVLICLLITYLFNQLDRYMLAITTKRIGYEIHYGDLACMPNHTLSAAERTGIFCNVTSQTECEAEETLSGLHACEWAYDGQGYQYQLLAGPAFIVIFTFAGIPLGFAADQYNRKNLLCLCLLLWSAFTLLTGFVTAYWHLLLLRLGLGIAEAGCTPFAASIIGDYFEVQYRATALGFYNWGIYIGYSLSYAVGNFITEANILGQSWRWAFILSGIPGIMLALLMLVTVKEPPRKTRTPSERDTEHESLLGDQQLVEPRSCEKLRQVLITFCSPSILLLCLAGSIRNAAGYVWAYNTQLFYEMIGQTPTQIGSWMSWIPLVAGSVSVVLGGFISDRVVVRRGPIARIMVIVISLLVASPFTAGALFLPAPWCYASLIPAYIFGEMWVGITLAILIEQVPATLRTTAVAFYLFIISNVGGNMPLVVPPLTSAFASLGLNASESLKWALLVLFPGEYVLGAILYLVALCAHKTAAAKTDLQSTYSVITGDRRESEGDESE